MFVMRNWHRFAALTALAGALALTGCQKAADAPTPEGDPTPAPQAPAPHERALDPTPGPGSNQPTPSAPIDLANAKPEATYTMREFVAEMTRDSNFPVSKHRGKVIEPTGVVTGYGFGPNAGSFMLSTGPNRLTDNRPEGVSDKHPWTKALPTQTVTLRARVATTNEVPDTYLWQFIEAKGPPPATQTAEELVKERTADPQAFDKKHQFGWVIVTGTVAGVKAAGGGGTEFQLAAGPRGQLPCGVPGPGNGSSPLSPAQTAALEPGLNVKVLGMPTSDALIDCILLEPAP